MFKKLLYNYRMRKLRKHYIDISINSYRPSAFNDDANMVYLSMIEQFCKFTIDGDLHETAEEPKLPLFGSPS